MGICDWAVVIVTIILSIRGGSCGSHNDDGGYASVCNGGSSG